MNNAPKYDLYITFWLKLRCFLSVFAAPVAHISTPLSLWPSISVEGYSWIWWSHTLRVSWLEGCSELLWQRWTSLISVLWKRPYSPLCWNLFAWAGDDLERELRQSPRSCVRSAAARRWNRRRSVWGGRHDLPDHHGGAAGGFQQQDQKSPGAFHGGLHCYHQHLGRVSEEKNCESTDEMRGIISCEIL